MDILPEISNNKSVFINCPFDKEYFPILKAIIFSVLDCGFKVRCALERDDSSEVRINKIYQLIGASAYGIHDLSRTKVKRGEFPRFNMPLELGIFLACKYFGSEEHANKRALILDEAKYAYQKSTSDLAGQDAKVHNGEPHTAITIIAHWLGQIQYANCEATPGPILVKNRFDTFTHIWPEMCTQYGQDSNDFHYTVYLSLATKWISDNPPKINA
jgi:hypothetical protein